LNGENGVLKTSGLYGDFYNRDATFFQRGSDSPAKKLVKGDIAGKITREEPK